MQAPSSEVSITARPLAPPMCDWVARWNALSVMDRSYHGENRPSHQHWARKHHWARSVVRWGTTCEPLVTICTFWGGRGTGAVRPYSKHIHMHAGEGGLAEGEKVPAERKAGREEEEWETFAAASWIGR